MTQRRHSNQQMPKYALSKLSASKENNYAEGIQHRAKEIPGMMSGIIVMVVEDDSCETNVCLVSFGKSGLDEGVTLSGCATVKIALYCVSCCIFLQNNACITHLPLQSVKTQDGQPIKPPAD